MDTYSSYPIVGSQTIAPKPIEIATTMITNNQFTCIMASPYMR